MSIARLAVRQEVSDSMIYRWEGGESLEKMVKDRLQRDLGVKMIEEIVDQPTPVMVSVKLSCDDKSMRSSLLTVYTMVAELTPVEYMYGVTPRIAVAPPNNWVVSGSSTGCTFVADGKVMDMEAPAPVEWQCSYCGSVNLIDEHLHCRKCGAPRKVLR